MKTAEYPHAAFLRKNNIDVEKLPKLIKQRINGFEEIQETLPYLVEEDQPVIEETLQKLSFEIEEDLEEEFEELLENNEIEEELVAVKDTQEEGENVEEEEVQEEEENVQDEEEVVQDEEENVQDVEEVVQDEEGNNQDENKDFVPELQPEVSTPEKALETVYEQGVRKLYPNELKELGIPIPNKRLQAVGNFCLIKGRYKNCYTLVLRQEKVKEK